MTEEYKNGDEKLDAFLALNEGARVGRYKIVRKLGSGGMGDVYLAEDTELNRLVALKFLSLMLISDKACKARFLREAQAVAKLNHPNVVTIHEVGEFNGRPYMTMEYIEGESLREMISKGPLEQEKAISIIREVSLGLSEAHTAGIVHRDIKPANILIDKKGHAKLLDFGLAAIQGVESLTKTGSTLGTISYMSPEQILGKELDYRSDIFSLGVVFYEMLSGRLPFRGDHEAVMMYSIANEEPEPLTTFKPGLDDNIQALFDALLIKDPNGRIQNAAELLESLDQLSDVSAAAAPSAQPKKSIAIMYFQDFAKSDDIGWLSKGIPHMLITSLEQSSYIDVVSYQKLFDILNQLGKADVESISMAVATQVAKRARATMMVTGCVFKYGNAIRIDYQINEVVSGRLAKAGKVIGEEPFSLADELGHQIRQQLEVEETGRNIADVTTHSIEAYKYYLEGLEHFNRAHDNQSAKCFEKAIACDPTFAMAYFWITWMTYLDQGSPGDYLEKAARYSKKLSPKEQQFIKSLIVFFESDFFKGTEHINPIGADFPLEREAHVVMWFLFPNLTDFKEAIRSIKKLISLDPLLPEPYHHLAYIYLYRGKIERALEMANKYMSLFPKEANPYDMLSEIYAYNGECGKAVEALQKAIRLRNNDYRYITHIGAIYQCMENFQKAEEYYHLLCKIDDKKANLIGQYYLGQLACYRGKIDEALKIYDRAISVNSSDRSNNVWLSKIYLAKSHIFLDNGQLDNALNEYHLAWNILESLSGKANTNVSIGWYKVQLLASQGVFDEAHRLAGEIKGEIERLIPHWIQLCYLMEAIIYSGENDYQKARQCLDQIDLRYINPNRMQIDLVCAKILLNSGDAEGASKVLEQLNSICHFNKAYWSVYMAKVPYLLGIAYDKMGQSEKAEAQFQKYLRIREGADQGILEIEDAKNRLDKLKANA